jgi:regulator of replication initiation timing
MDDRRSGMKERGYDKLFSDITIEELSHKIVRLAKQRDEWQEKAMNMIEKSTHKELELENQRLVQQLEHDETVVPKEAYEAMKERYQNQVVTTEYWKKLAEDNFIASVNDSETSNVWKERYEHELKNAEYWKDTYYNNQPKGCGYVFSEIPNDTDGQEFVDNMKKYFNKKSYKMRVRGQHIKPELKGTGATYFGQNLNESTHMRVYIDNKN